MREYLNAGEKEPAETKEPAVGKDDSAPDSPKPGNKAVAGGASLKGRGNSGVNAAVAGSKKGAKGKRGGGGERNDGKVVRFSVGEKRGSQDEGTNTARRQLGLPIAKDEGDTFDVTMKVPKKKPADEENEETGDKGDGKNEIDIGAAKVQKKAGDDSQRGDGGEGEAGGKDTKTGDSASGKGAADVDKGKGKDKDKDKDKDIKSEKKGGRPQEDGGEGGGRHGRRRRGPGGGPRTRACTEPVLERPEGNAQGLHGCARPRGQGGQGARRRTD